MTSLHARLANILLRHAEAVMPERRAEWARAMRAEADHLPARERLVFARGCVWSSYRERLADPATLLTVGRWFIAIGLCAASAIPLRTAYLGGAGDASSLILMLGLIALAALAAFLRWGISRLPTIAAAGFGGALLAMLLAGDVNALASGAMTSGRFYRALLIEQVIAWAALFGLGQLLLALDAQRRAHD